MGGRSAESGIVRVSAIARRQLPTKSVRESSAGGSTSQRGDLKSAISARGAGEFLRDTGLGDGSYATPSFTVKNGKGNFDVEYYISEGKGNNPYIVQRNQESRQTGASRTTETRFKTAEEAVDYVEKRVYKR